MNAQPKFKNRPDARLLALITAIVAAAAGFYLLAPHQDAQAPAPSATSSATPALTPTPSSTITASPATWQTSAFSQTYPAVTPPTPILKAIHTAPHPEGGYDRISFDIEAKAAPGYRVSYVPKVVKDGSGQVVALPGSAYLQIVFNPASAHTDAGQPLISPAPSRPVAVNYPELQSYVMNGDFEGQVSVVLGLRANTGFRTSHTGSGSLWTVYVDVRHP